MALCLSFLLEQLSVCVNSFYRIFGSANIPAPGAFVVVASNLTAFAARYGPAVVAIGVWKDNYGGLGKHISLKYQSDVDFIDLKFNNDTTWPNKGDKAGTRGTATFVKFLMNIVMFYFDS
jgi:hypothetical protein